MFNIWTAKAVADLKRNVTIQREQNRTIQRLNATIEQQRPLLIDYDQQMSEAGQMNATSYHLNEMIQSYQQNISTLDDVLIKLDDSLDELNKNLSDVNASIDQRSHWMDTERQSVNEQQLHVNELNRTLEENRPILIQLNKKIDENVQLLEEKAEQVDKLRQEFEAAYGLCSSAECVSTADDLARSMDTNVDPCQDFYRFACGGFPRNYPVPEGLESWNASQKLDKDTRNLIKG